MADVVFYPDAYPEDTSVDGYAHYIAGSALYWSEIRMAVGNGAAHAEVSLEAPIMQSSTITDKFHWLRRAYILFDTSRLPDDVEILSASVFLNGHEKLDEAGWLPTVNIFGANPLSNTDIVAADFGSRDNNPYCDTPIGYNDWVLTNYNEFVLNEAGLAAISVGGISKFSFYFDRYDADGEVPVWGSFKKSMMTAYAADNADEGYRPKLVITYAPLVTTQVVTAIDGSTATGNGNIIDLGGPTATQHGHCWNTTGLPTITEPLVHTTSGGRTENGVPSATGAFTSAITELVLGNIYYIRAYATNDTGTGYGEQVTFIAGAPTAGDRAGPIRIVEDRLHYADAYGVERWLKGTPVQ